MYLLCDWVMYWLLIICLNKCFGLFIIKYAKLARKNVPAGDNGSRVTTQLSDSISGDKCDLSQGCRAKAELLISKMKFFWS